MDRLWRDLRYAVRSLRKSPTFTAVVVLTLGLGIAASTVVFAVVKTVLLDALPYGDPDRLVAVAEGDGRSLTDEGISPATAQEWMRRTHLFDRISLYGDSAVRPVLNGRVEMLRGMRVTTDYFETLGVPMFLGRSFRPEEGEPGAPHAVILTYGTWTEHFGADRTVVGRTIPDIGGSVTVVGVLPPDFHPLHMSNPAELPRVFQPLVLDAAAWGVRAPWLRGIARLRTGVTSRRAQAELEPVMRTLAHDYPEYPAGASALVTPLREHLVGTFGSALWMLQASVLALLVLGCANAATLLIARTTARENELAIRAALGAGHVTLVRQLLTECAILSVAAAAGGVSLAWIATRFIAATANTNIPRIGELAPNGSVLLFGIAAAVGTIVLFGLAPALVASRRALASVRIGQNVIGRRSHHRTLRALVAAELGLAFALVFVASLLSNSYLRLMRVDPGFDPQHVLTLSLLPAGEHYSTPVHRLGYFDAVVERMRTIPGVEDAAYASTLPLSHPSAGAVFIREHPPARDADAPKLDVYLVSPNYLDVMKIPVVRGRRFTDADSQTAPPVAVISESTARTQFRGDDPIGRHLRTDAERPWAEIVGVVGDVHQHALDGTPGAAVYFPFAQRLPPVQGYASLVVRSTPLPERMEAAVRTAMRSVDPLQPIFHLQPMTTYIALSVSQRTFALVLVTAFGLLGLLLATVGVYAVVSYVVEQRRREVGLRLALGATPGHVRWMIVREVLVAAFTGVSCGFGVATLFTQGLSTLLFGVTRFDPETTCVVTLTLMAAALIASAAPVSRAARVGPMDALRSE